MSKFKVGDRVRVVASCQDLRRLYCDRKIKSGRCYFITRVDSDNQPYQLDYIAAGFVKEHMIELASSFHINSGDYIDSREFTREECERFCELAVERGFGRGEWMRLYEEDPTDSL